MTLLGSTLNKLSNDSEHTRDKQCEMLCILQSQVDELTSQLTIVIEGVMTLRRDELYAQELQRKLDAECVSVRQEMHTVTRDFLDSSRTQEKAVEVLQGNMKRDLEKTQKMVQGLKADCVELRTELESDKRITEALVRSQTMETTNST